MAFDFTKIIAEETKKQEANAQASSGGNSFGFNTLYPFGNGRLELKLIGNEPSGLLYRELTFHEYYQGKNKMKVPCLHQMYGMDCPICNAVSNVQNQLDDQGVFRKYGYKKQGIMFARLLGFAPDNYFNDNKKPPKIGDVVLFMFPKSVINELRNLIIEFSDEIPDLFTNNITRQVTLKIGTQSNGFPEYSFYVKGNTTPLVVDAMGNPDEAGFATYMANMPNLNEVRFPSKPDENIMNIHRTLVEQINNEYFGTPVNQPMPNPQPMNYNTTSQPNIQPPVYTGTPLPNPTKVTNTQTSVQPNVNVAPVQENVQSTPVTPASVGEAPDLPAVDSAPKFEEPVENTEATTDPRGPRPSCFGNNCYNEECSKCPWDPECI